jgi:hypothetical protein
MGAAEKQASDFESLSFIHTVLWAHVIIPLNPLTKKPCIKGWREITENTDAELEEWNRQFPNAMVGILTGRPSGFFAIDLDVKPERKLDGYASLRDLEKQHGKLPDTKQTATPGGGGHHYFKLPPGVRIRNRASQFAPGIDVRSTGGYVVAAGSVRSDGKTYKDLNEKSPAEAPPWVLFNAIFNNSTRARLAARNIRCAADFGDLPPAQWEAKARELCRPASSKGSPGALTDARKAAILKYVKDAIAKECAEISEAPEGYRDNDLYAGITRCMSLIRGAEQEGVNTIELEDEAFLDIVSAAYMMGNEWDESECQRKWESLVDVVEPRDLSHVGLDAKEKPTAESEFDDLGGAEAGQPGGPEAEKPGAEKPKLLEFMSELRQISDRARRARHRIRTHDSRQDVLGARSGNTHRSRPGLPRQESEAGAGPIRVSRRCAGLSESNDRRKRSSRRPR